MGPGILLGIETSCDETAASVVRNGTEVFSSVIASSMEEFREGAGVIPELAARRQVEWMMPVIAQAMTEAGVEHGSLSAIAVTKGPGLLGSLLVGTGTARVLSSLWDVPLIGVHHTLGHLSSTWLGTGDAPTFPVLTLSVSGGHSDLWLRKSHTSGTLLSSTRDDAVGEAFDKGASLLGLPYPGGPSLANMATGSRSRFPFSLPLRGEDTMDFSFSGLKTALRYHIRDLGDRWVEHRHDLAASFQEALCAHLLDRVQKALESNTVRELHVVGGVSANARLRELLSEAARKHGVTLRLPGKPEYCTDNAAMIASAGYFLLQEQPDRDHSEFSTAAQLSLAQALSA